MDFLIEALQVLVAAGIFGGMGVYTLQWYSKKQGYPQQDLKTAVLVNALAITVIAAVALALEGSSLRVIGIASYLTLIKHFYRINWNQTWDAFTRLIIMMMLALVITAILFWIGNTITEMI